MIKLLLIVMPILLIVMCFVYKVKIKWRTFLKKGFLPARGNFGIYCYCGAQGRGKTYSVVEYLLDNKDNIVVFCNVSGIQGLDYFYFTGFEELIKLKKILDYEYNDHLELKDYCIELGFSLERASHLVDLIEYYRHNNKQLVFVYDEIFTELQRGSKVGQQVLDFLCQMRKRKIIFLTTAQYWSEIPITFRKFCRYEIDCKMYNFLVVGILLKHFRDAEQMKWNDQEQDFVAPLISNTITKCRKNIANSYDTFLRISSVTVEAGAPLTSAPNENR